MSGEGIPLTEDSSRAKDKPFDSPKVESLVVVIVIEGHDRTNLELNETPYINARLNGSALSFSFPLEQCHVTGSSTGNRFHTD
jgi:hypothetical protein